MLICAAAGGQPAVNSAFPNGVASGDVTQRSAVLWARRSSPGAVTFDWSTDAGFSEIEGSVTIDVSDPAIPAKLEVDDLSPARRYFYRALSGEGDVARGTFVTLHVGERRGLRFGVSGDWRGDLSPYPSISNVPARGLDLFIALGDTTYADFASPDLPLEQAVTLSEFRIKQNEVYSERGGVNRLADLRASTAILAVIDDHEVTNDFAGGAATGSDPRFDVRGAMLNETELFENGLTAFVEYNPIRDEFYGDTGDARTAGKRKLYRRRDYGLDAVFLILDARSFRDEPLDEIRPGSPQQRVESFMMDSFDPARTMLGEVQVTELLADLLDAHQLGVVWKFILVPEPIQNFGPFLASDRFEGYAAERSRILRFIDENDIANVVFIAADIHGTVVNNLTYRRAFGEPLREIDAFEVTTGPVAFDPPFGPTVVAFADADAFGPLASIFQGVFSIAGRSLQDSLVALAGDVILDQFGLDRIGLAGSSIDARLLTGGYVATNHYGWSEFEIDPQTAELTVTTWGVNWYTADQAARDPSEVDRRTPQIINRFVVQARCEQPAQCTMPTPSTGLCGAMGAINMLALFSLTFFRFRIRWRLLFG